MEMNLSKYVANYENFLDSDYCKKTVKDLKKAEWSTHQFYQADSKDYISYENELSVSWSNVKQRKEIQDKLWDGLQRYCNELPDVAGARVHEWYAGWNGYSELRFNRYLPGKLMTEHCDHIHSLFDGKRKGIPTLSILGLLNDDFEGGDFVMFTDQKIEFNKGDLLVFPSNFLYPHRVEEVKSGTRFSFISWSF